MDFDARTVPCNADLALLAWVSTQVSARHHQVAERDEKRAYLTLKIQRLTPEPAHLRRIRFGKKSEAVAPEQRDLLTERSDEDIAAVRVELEAAPSPPQAESKPRESKRPGRNALPPELPRIEHRHEPASCHCGACESARVQIGEDISEPLDVEPARFFVHRHIRPQYACRAGETVTAEPVPPSRYRRRSSTVAWRHRACLPGC